MDFPNAIPCLNNKTILITGATGFVAKVLVEKILRIQPDIKKLYLLIRVKGNKSPWERLYDEIISKDLFRVLKERHGAKFDNFISRNVTPVAGDAKLHDLGIEDCNLREEMWKQIDVVVHLAATTRLNERYDTALDINAYGPKNIINFMEKCIKPQMLIHVSTAYVCGEATGLIPERQFKMGETLNGVSGLDIDAERRLAENTLVNLKNKGASIKQIRKAMRSLGLQRSRIYGWPNTYVFSKALGEMLIDESRDNLHVVIVRPTMVCGTYREPFRGWMEGLGHIVMVSMASGKGYLTFGRGDKDATMDLIPVDMVVNAITTIMVAHTKQPYLAIYHVGSSARNPITMGKLCDIHYQYFIKKPWVDEKGVSVKCGNWQKTLTKSKLMFVSFCIIHSFKMLALCSADVLSCHIYKANYRQLGIQLGASIRMSSKLFRPYAFFRGIFDDTNSHKLWDAMLKKGMHMDDFDFNPETIDWDEYMINSHIPGVVKYIF